MAFAALACALPTAITDDSSLDDATAACRASNGQSSPGFWPSGAQACALPHRRRWAFFDLRAPADQREREPWPAASIHRRRSRNGGQLPVELRQPGWRSRQSAQLRQLSCSVDSRRWSATLLSTSWVRFDARGLPKGLPATRMAQGRCWIDANTVSCESHSRNVAGMSAEAQL